MQQGHEQHAGLPSIASGASSGISMRNAQPCQPCVQFIDLPVLWQQSLLLHHLDAAARSALFQTCSAMAGARVQHTPHLTLRPTPSLQQDSRRRAAVLRIAAGCKNITLDLQGCVIPLDTPCIWGSITHLVLCDVSLDSSSISSLHLEQLTQVHTLSVKSNSSFLKARVTNRGLKSVKGAAVPGSIGSNLSVDVPGLQRVVKAGGLFSLRHVCCKGWRGPDAYAYMCQLGAALGHKVTELTAWCPKVLMAVRTFPGLQRLTIPHHYDADEEEVTGHDGAITQLFGHPQMKQLVVDTGWLACVRAFDTGASTSHAHSDRRGRLACLQLTGPPFHGVLSHFPLQHVQHLQVLDSRWSIPHGTVNGIVANLLQCPKVDVGLTGSCQRFSKRFRSSSLAADMPAFEVTFNPQLLRWLFAACQGLTGVLFLVTEGSFYPPLTHVGSDHLTVLGGMPVGVHTLGFSDLAMSEGCSWADFIGHTPSHVHAIHIRSCRMTLEDLKSVTSHPPPQGLERLVLARDKEYMPWVYWYEDDVSALLAERWPHVHVELDTKRSWEDSGQIDVNLFRP